MKKHFVRATGVALLALSVPLSACGSDGDSATDEPVPTTVAVADTTEAPASTEPPTTQAPDSTTEAAPAEQPLSDFDAIAARVMSALDELGVAHTDPVRDEVSLSGAVARFEFEINGNLNGINIYNDPETLATWQEASNMLGGVHVAFDLVTISLNSKAGIAESVELAGPLAEKLGGEAHGN